MRNFAKLALYVVLLAGGFCAADDSDRKLVSREEPEYPSLAAKMNLHGTVKLKIWVDVEGNVRRVEYVGGHPLLAESAVKTVKKWKYQPGAKESIAQVELKF